MLKRLIEVALPLKEVSAQSAREKSIRHGHISTLHIWWARRPLAACRAVVFASLIPDPDDPECPTSFKQLVMEVLGSSQFRPTQPEPSPGAATSVETKPLEDTPRNRCLEFIKHLVRWENSNEPHYIDPARRLIKEAHKILHPDSDSETPKVLDPFAGGGAIPLEALRLGCEAHAIDINPVAHLIQLCTLVYPQKFGRPLSKDRPVPDYILDLNAAHSASKSSQGTFDYEGGKSSTHKPQSEIDGVSVADLPLITEAEYRKNPLAADVKFWGHWILEKARHEIGHLYPNGPDGSVRLAYLWANTLPCPNPSCRVTVPLTKQTWLARSATRKVAIHYRPRGRTVELVIKEGKDVDPPEPTIRTGAMRCPVCLQGIYDKDAIKLAAQRHLGVQQIGVVSQIEHKSRNYEPFSAIDSEAIQLASDFLERLKKQSDNGISLVPDEPVGTDFEWALTVSLFGLTKWADQFSPRQLVALSTFAKLISKVLVDRDDAYGIAVRAVLTMVQGRLADKSAIHCIWRSDGEYVEHVFGRQALSMPWDYAEVNPFSGQMGDWTSAMDWVIRNVFACSKIPAVGRVMRGSATRLPFLDESVDAVITDPPYYDAVPYADLSDFFYVWHKRCLKRSMPDLYHTLLTPKKDELVQQSSRYTPEEKRKKTREFFESGMRDSFSEIARVVDKCGVAGVMFAHKTTTAWEALIQGLNDTGTLVTSTWPIHTEMKARLRAKTSAALASSVLLTCRKRAKDVAEGTWDDVRRELRELAAERLDFFWKQGIRGADFFISAIGPALSVFGRYKKVKRLSGEEVTVGQFLDEVRDLVTHYALNKIIKGGQVGHIDAESQYGRLGRP